MRRGRRGVPELPKKTSERRVLGAAGQDMLKENPLIAFLYGSSIYFGAQKISSKSNAESPNKEKIKKAVPSASTA
jgi:hypothetical protein